MLARLNIYGSSSVPRVVIKSESEAKTYNSVPCVAIKPESEHNKVVPCAVHLDAAFFDALTSACARVSSRTLTRSAGNASFM